MLFPYTDGLTMIVTMSEFHWLKVCWLAGWLADLHSRNNVLNVSTLNLHVALHQFEMHVQFFPHSKWVRMNFKFGELCRTFYMNCKMVNSFSFFSLTHSMKKDFYMKFIYISFVLGRKSGFFTSSACGKMYIWVNHVNSLKMHLRMVDWSDYSVFVLAEMFTCFRWMGPLCELCENRLL